MRILFAGNKERGTLCLKALVARGDTIVAVLAHPSDKGPASDSLTQAASQLGLPVIAPRDVNDPKIPASLRELRPELTVLAGYGPIVRQPFIDIAPKGAINLHGGKLPQYRGSSPMNWALINGEKEITLSVIAVDTGVDTGDVLTERTFPVGADDTIAQVQARSNELFPEMLVEVVAAIEAGKLTRRKQLDSEAAYFPLRFPDDGILLWDQLDAQQIHNRIRALTEPYPGAVTFFGRERVKLLRSSLAKKTFHGEPGRVYLKNENGLLVCARDRCLWVQRAVFEKSGQDAIAAIARYAKFATMRDLAIAALVS